MRISLLLQIILFILALKRIFGDQFTFHLLVAEITVKNPSSIFLLLFVLTTISICISYNRSLQDYISGGKMRDVSLFIIITIPLLFLYLSGEHFQGTHDSLTSRYLPLTIMFDGDLDFDEYKNLRKFGGGYFFRRTDQHLYPAFPLGPGFMVLPLYILVSLSGFEFTDYSLLWLERISAACIISLSAFVLFLVMRKLTTRGNAFLLTMVYALGTSSWSTSSQALWQHGPTQLCLVLALFLLLKIDTNRFHALLTGFVLGFTLFIRPTNIIFIAVFSLYILIKHTHVFWKYFVGLVFISFLFLLTNYSIYGSLAGCYDLLYGKSCWTSNIMLTAYALLFNPNRGLIIFSPVFIFCLFGIKPMIRKNFLFTCIFGGMICFFLVYCRFYKWWGGYSYGPRYLSDITPFLILFLIPFMEHYYFRKPWKFVFSLLLVYSVFIQAVGVFTPALQWNRYYSIDSCPEYLWNWKNGQIAVSIRGINTEKVFPKKWNRGECVSRTGTIEYDDLLSFHIHANSEIHEPDYILLGCFCALDAGKYKITMRTKIKQNSRISPLTVEVFANDQTEVLVDQSIYGAAEQYLNWQENSIDFSLKEKDKIEFRLYFEGDGEVWVNTITLVRKTTGNTAPVKIFRDPT